MNKEDYPKAGLQRLFQKGADNFVLLHKNGKVVAFQSNQNGNVLGRDCNTAGCLNNAIEWYKNGLSKSKFHSLSLLMILVRSTITKEVTLIP